MSFLGSKQSMTTSALAYLASCTLKVSPFRGWCIAEGFPISMVLSTLGHLKEVLGIVEDTA